jgi:hypothetical protein
MTVQDIGQRTADFVLNASAETATRVLHKCTSLCDNAASNCQSELAAFLRIFAKKKTVYGGQIDWPCYSF